jgi:hypothetical protein
MMGRVTGIGGVFFKSSGGSAALAAWYRQHLGLPLEDCGGAILRWPKVELWEPMLWDDKNKGS